MQVRNVARRTVVCDEALELSTIRGELSVVHVGQHSVLLSAVDGALVAITDSERGLAPGGIMLTVPELFSLGTTAQAAGSVNLEFTNVTLLRRSLELNARTDLAILRGTLYTALNEATEGDTGAFRSFGLSSARALRKCAPHAAFVALSGLDLAPHLYGLVGAGPGATPTGDDLIVGMLAGFRLAGAEFACSHLATAVLPLLGRTTRASAHDIRAAVDGRFAEHLHVLIDHLVAGDVAAASILIGRWGSTSGADVAHGLLAALDAALAVPHEMSSTITHTARSAS